MATNRGTPLDDVPAWSGEYATTLAAKGITDAEQVVAIGANASGVDALATELGLSVPETERLVNQARSHLPTAEVTRLEAPVPRHGLGVVPPQPDNAG